MKYNKHVVSHCAVLWLWIWSSTLLKLLMDVQVIASYLNLLCQECCYYYQPPGGVNSQEISDAQCRAQKANTSIKDAQLSKCVVGIILKILLEGLLGFTCMIIGHRETNNWNRFLSILSIYPRKILLLLHTNGNAAITSLCITKIIISGEKHH